MRYNANSSSFQTKESRSRRTKENDPTVCRRSSICDRLASKLNAHHALKWRMYHTARNDRDQSVSVRRLHKTLWYGIERLHGLVSASFNAHRPTRHTCIHSADPRCSRMTPRRICMCSAGFRRSCLLQGFPSETAFVNTTKASGVRLVLSSRGIKHRTSASCPRLHGMTGITARLGCPSPN